MYVQAAAWLLVAQFFLSRCREVDISCGPVQVIVTPVAFGFAVGKAFCSVAVTCPWARGVDTGLAVSLLLLLFSHFRLWRRGQRQKNYA